MDRELCEQMRDIGFPQDKSVMVWANVDCLSRGIGWTIQNRDYHGHVRASPHLEQKVAIPTIEGMLEFAREKLPNRPFQKIIWNWVHFLSSKDIRQAATALAMAIIKAVEESE